MDAANISHAAWKTKGANPGPVMKGSGEASLKVLLQSGASLHGRTGGFVLLIEVNFLGYQFAGHVGEDWWPLHISPALGKWHCSFTATRTFIIPKSNYKQGAKHAATWLGEISIRLIRLAGQRREQKREKIKIDSKEGVGQESVRACVGVGWCGLGGRSVLCTSGKSIGQWVISGGCG